jgi:hypothetical protein
MDKKIKIYVGCALTHASEEFRTSIATFKEQLRGDFEIMDFLWAKLKDPRNVDPKDVYEWDINDCVKNCDLFVAVCDEVSLGLGYELGTAIEKYNKPVLVLIQKERKLTRLIEGIQHKDFSLRVYESLATDGIMYVKEKTKAI